VLKTSKVLETFEVYTQREPPAANRHCGLPTANLRNWNIPSTKTVEENVVQLM